MFDRLELFAKRFSSPKAAWFLNTESLQGVFEGFSGEEHQLRMGTKYELSRESCEKLLEILKRLRQRRSLRGLANRKRSGYSGLCIRLMVF